MDQEDFQSLDPESRFVVAFDDKAVTCRRPDGGVESVAWSDLRAVVIETNSLGPLACDLYWLLLGEEGGCVIPQGATGGDRLLNRLQQLPGFDNEKVIEAMCCTEESRFVCWTLDSGS